MLYEVRKRTPDGELTAPAAAGVLHLGDQLRVTGARTETVVVVLTLAEGESVAWHRGGHDVPITHYRDPGRTVKVGVPAGGQVWIRHADDWPDPLPDQDVQVATENATAVFLNA